MNSMEVQIKKRETDALPKLDEIASCLMGRISHRAINLTILSVRVYHVHFPLFAVYIKLCMAKTAVIYLLLAEYLLLLRWLEALEVGPGERAGQR